MAKIKIIGVQYGVFQDGQIVEAVVSYDGMNAVAFQPNTISYFWFSSAQFILVKEEPEKKKETIEVHDILTLREQGHFSVDEIVKLKQGGCL